MIFIFFFSSRRRHTRFDCDWSSDVCSSDLYWRKRLRKPPKRRWALDTFLRRAAFWFLLIVIWEAIFRFKVFPAQNFPSLCMALGKFAEGFISGEYLLSLKTSLLRIGIGYSLAILLGIFLGVAMGLVKFLDEGISGILLGLQSMGHAAWVPFAVLFFGENELAVIFIVQISAMIVVTMNTESGIKFVSPQLINQARISGIKGISLFREVILPAADRKS